MDQINVIPFIDIMLVLLAIVLMTATFISEGRLKISLPEATSEADSGAVASVEIAIDAAGGLFFNAAPVSLHALGARLDGLDKTTSLLLRIDAASSFQHFVAVVDQLKARQLERLTILTERR